MLAGATLLLAILGFMLLRVSIFAAGLCWVGAFYAGTMAEKRSRESRLFPALVVLAAAAFLIRLGLWVWHVI
jgi:hypothetical protein